MVKKVSRKNYDSGKYTDFRKVSDNFYEGAKVASEFEYYNAAEVLIVHAAIALADAVTIRLSSTKCAGNNHYEIIHLLKESVAGSKENNSALIHFEKIIDHKNAVSYQGEIYKKADITKLFKHFERFKSWTDSVF